jgi:hypothetical protein
MEVQYPTLYTETYLSHPGVRFIHHIAEHVIIFQCQRASFQVELPCNQYISNHVDDNEGIEYNEAQSFVFKVESY